LSHRSTFFPYTTLFRSWDKCYISNEYSEKGIGFKKGTSKFNYKFMDRIYYNNELTSTLFKEWAMENGYHHKKHQSFDDDIFDVIDRKSTRLNSSHVKIS